MIRRNRFIKTDQLHEAVADLPDASSVCATVKPKGVPIQLHYGNFILERIYTGGKSCLDVTDIMLSQVPNMIENDYLHSSCNGDFELSGQLWISDEQLSQLNSRLSRTGFSPYKSPSLVVEKFLLRDIPLSIEDTLHFTPMWSTTLFDLALFATYEEFLTVVGTDFSMPGHITTTVKTIDNITSFYEVVRIMAINQNEHSINRNTPIPETIVILKDDLTRIRGPYSDIEETIIAELELPVSERTTTIDNITVGPDRSGRIHPVITVGETMFPPDGVSPIRSWLHANIPLKDVGDLLKKGYQEGDEVTLSSTSGIPKLGDITRKGSLEANVISNGLKEYHARICVHCQEPLIQHGLSYFCDNPACSGANFYKLIYACQQGVLDIRMTPYDLFNFIRAETDDSLTTPVYNLLTTKAEELREIVWLGDIMDTLYDISCRINQLRGVGYSPDIQRITQCRLIDALSIRGMYRENINKLRNGLENGSWRWTELASVLTSPSKLCSLSISPRDANTISTSAGLHLVEVTAFSII